jgi:molybdopterin converting factor small subunit
VEVTVRLFAVLRERAGVGEIVLDLPDGARVDDALERLDGLADGLPLVLAVNREYAPADRVLAAGDEIALIPPVSGGERGAPAIHAAVSEAPLSLDSLAARVADPRAGAVVTFQGVTRDVPGSRQHPPYPPGQPGGGRGVVPPYPRVPREPMNTISSWSRSSPSLSVSSDLSA